MKQIRTLLFLFLVCAILAAGQSPAALAAESSREGRWPGASAEEPTGTRKNLSGKYFLIANINLADLAWIPIGAYFYKPIAGTFDGNGHAMVGCSVQNSTGSSSRVGLITALGIEFGCSSNPVAGKQNGANGGAAGLVGSDSALAERNRDGMISYLDAIYIMDVLAGTITEESE